MGWLRVPTKDFIQMLKLVKRKNNLMKASILFYSLPFSYSTAPRTIKYRSPCVFCRSRILLYPSPIAPACIRLVVAFDRPAIGGRKRPQQILIILFLCPLIWRSKWCDRVLPHHHWPAPRLTLLYSIAWAVFRLVVASPHPAEAIKTYGPVALSIYSKLNYLSFDLYE